MDKKQAVDVAIELAKIALDSSETKVVPNAKVAESVAEFIETLAARLENLSK